MLKLLHQGHVFAPEPLGRKDILIMGNRIGAICEPDQVKIEGIEVQHIDASDRTVVPGFIDSHVHITGGGGEGGPATRAPEIAVEDIISNGVTTVIGCLGTDSVTRHMESLLAKAKGLEEEGVTSYIFSGSYEIPPKTITGSIRSDLVLIDKVIGAGEVAISDHRSSQPSFEEIARLAADCRVGGMLGGKAGVLHCHIGDGQRRLGMLFRLIKETEIPVTQVIPTHVNRNRQLMEEAIEFVLAGGFIDLTASGDSEPPDKQGVSIEDALALFLEKQIPLDRITISSDSNGSLPLFDARGELQGLTIATQKGLLAKFRTLVQNKILSLQDSLKLFSTNPAHFYKFHQKGEIKPGKDADLLLLDKNLNLTDCFALGRRMMAGGKLFAKGTFSGQ